MKEKSSFMGFFCQERAKSNMNEHSFIALNTLQLDIMTIYRSANKMRLSKIKLSGFKSFVDPTSITFPSNLVGVVGPNGCGKSNVIDAVRWVMGEAQQVD